MRFSMILYSVEISLSNAMWISHTAFRVFWLVRGAKRVGALARGGCFHALK